MKRWLLCGLALIALIMFWAVAFGAHHLDWSWMRECCGKDDCLPIAVAILGNGLEPGEWMVRIDTAVLSVHKTRVRLSADRQTYVCLNIGYPKEPPQRSEAVRCVFYVVGG